jgi:hypothetical protein
MTEKSLVLTKEQLQKIDENRLKAQEILKRKREIELDIDKLIVNRDLLSNCQFCDTNAKIDKMLLETFDERICFTCKKNSDQFDMLTKSDSSAKYLITDESYKTLKYATKNNPLNAGWQPMKLYLRKHVLEVAIKKFGSAEEFEAEKKRRNLKKFNNELELINESLDEDSSNLFKNSFKDFAESNEVEKGNQNIINGKKNKKKKKSYSKDLLEIVNCIRGT